VSQQETALMSVNDKLTSAHQDNDKLRHQLDDALRHAADERERSATMHLLALNTLLLSYVSLLNYNLHFLM